MLIEAEERKQTDLKQAMVSDTLRAELDLPADDCFSDHLTTDFENFSKSTCYTIASAEGEFGAQTAESLANCLDRNTFCETCCNFHIGIIHNTKRMNCANECNSKIFTKEEDLGVKATPDAVDVRIPRTAALTDDNTTPTPNYMRFKEVSTPSQQEMIDNQKKQEAKLVQEQNSLTNKEFNMK